MARDYFYCSQSHHRPVNYLPTAVQLTNQLLRFWADGGFVYYKRLSSPSFLVWSQSVIIIIASWFAIALDEIRTKRILREKADCKQSKAEHSGRVYTSTRVSQKNKVIENISTLTSLPKFGTGSTFVRAVHGGVFVMVVVIA